MSADEPSKVTVPLWWLNDVIAILEDLGTHRPLVIEAEVCAAMTHGEKPQP